MEQRGGSVVEELLDNVPLGSEFSLVLRIHQIRMQNH